MTQRQRENTAKYLYDLSKIVFAAGVVGNLVAWKRFDVIDFCVGVAAAYLFFWMGFHLDRVRERDG